MAYDYRLHINDVYTPVSFCTKPGTIVCRYGKRLPSYEDVTYHDRWDVVRKTTYLYYPDLVDIQFDHREEVSKGHFTKGIEYV